MNDPDVLDALRAVLERDLGPATLWLHYGELCLAACRPVDAVGALRKALDHDATRARAERRIVPALREARQLAEALIRIEDLLAVDPKSGELHAEHARVLRERGSNEEADRAEARARESEPLHSRRKSLLSLLSRAGPAHLPVPVSVSLGERHPVRVALPALILPRSGPAVSLGGCRGCCSGVRRGAEEGASLLLL